MFELLSQQPENAERYVFEAVEVKETSFRLDGVFMPPDRAGVVYFAEVQFQPDELLYERMDAEIGIFVYRNRAQLADWAAVVIYPTLKSGTIPHRDSTGDVGKWQNYADIFR